MVRLDFLFLCNLGEELEPLSFILKILFISVSSFSLVLTTMLYRLHKFLPALFASLALATGATSAAQTLDNQTLTTIERETTRLLLEKDVGEVANQLARDGAATTVVPLLRRLTIFARAGQRGRVLQTIHQLAEASDMPPVSHRWVAAAAVKEIIGHDDLKALRAYSEQIMSVDTSIAEQLVRLWEKEGDAKELDTWLAARGGQSVEWSRRRIYLRARLGTIKELLDELAAEVKANPEDRARVSLYLEANNLANRLQDVSWLAEALQPRNAFEFYEVGSLLRTDAPETATRLLEKSLEQPFTEQDMTLIRERILSRFPIQPRVRNWEKQLRFWTKKHLAELYRTLNQPHAAQIMVEQLVAMKADEDIMTEDVHQLAGAVQAQSGMRVVEAGILRDEANERASLPYWLERARYYAGRKEYATVMETYRQALVHLPLKLQEAATVGARLTLLQAFTMFATSRDAHEDGKRQERREEIKQILRREFTSAPLETLYALGVARIVANDEFELDDLKEALFVRDKDALSRVLAARTEWAGEENWLIESIVCRESVSPQSKTHFWAQLETLATDGAASRAFHLADAMLSCREPGRAIPLLLGYLRQTKAERDDKARFREEQGMSLLINAYLDTDNWRAAEKLLLSREDLTERELIYELSLIAQVAARAGAFSDAVRLWKMKSNLDRRPLDGLGQLATTKAKEPLREFYLQMKKKDPLSFVPDAALRFLQ